MSTPPDLVRCAGVARTFGAGAGAVVAVSGVSCSVVSGQSTALVGPSGCGKSTLLHLLAGLEHPTVGAVTWPSTGHSPWGRPREVGVVFQGPSLLAHLDVTENVALPLLLDGSSPTDARDRARESLDALGLGGLAHALPDTLSGGQAQRVAIARVLASAPELILADEPTGQLDHQAAALVIDVLLRASEEIGAALVISTHDPLIAHRLPEQWTMRDGAMLAPGAGLSHAAVAS